MRTTVNLDDDVLATAEQLRREQHLTLSEAVNELARRGLARHRGGTPFSQRTTDLGLRVDVVNVAEALEHLDEAS